MKKRLLVLMLAMMTAATAITGCGAKESDTKQEKPDKDDNDKKNGKSDEGDKTESENKADKPSADNQGEKPDNAQTGAVDPSAEAAINPTILDADHLFGGLRGKVTFSEEKTEEYMNIYRDTLNNIYALIVNPEGYDWEDDSLYGVWEAANYENDALNTIGYTFMDVSGDGSCELIVGSRNDYSQYDDYGTIIYDIYSFDGVSVNNSLYGHSRNACKFLKDGRLFFEWSSGYAYSGISVGSLLEDGSKYVIDSQYYTAPRLGSESDIDIYFNTSGDLNERPEDKLDISLDDFFDIYTTIGMYAETINLTPFSEFVKEFGMAGIEMFPPVDIHFANEVSFDPDDVLEIYNIDDTQYTVGIILYAQEDISNLCVNYLEFRDFTADGKIVFSKYSAQPCGNLSAGDCIIINIEMAGTIPNYGISFTSQSGQPKNYSINMSGEDGSLFFEEF